MESNRSEASESSRSETSESSGRDSPQSSHSSDTVYASAPETPEPDTPPGRLIAYGLSVLGTGRHLPPLPVGGLVWNRAGRRYLDGTGPLPPGYTLPSASDERRSPFYTLSPVSPPSPVSDSDRTHHRRRPSGSELSDESRTDNVHEQRTSPSGSETNVQQTSTSIEAGNERAQDKSNNEGNMTKLEEDHDKTKSSVEQIQS